MEKRNVILLFLYLVFLCGVSCKQQDAYPPAIVDQAVSPDSLINLWNAAWNSHDSSAIAKMFTAQSQVVFSEKNSITGTDSIMSNWVSKNLPEVTNLKTQNIASASNKEFAYYAGSYSLDARRNDAVTETNTGYFTMIWKQQTDQSWKIELLFFGR